MSLLRLGKCKHCLGHAFDADRPVKNWKGSRCTFMLLDGSFMDLAICEDCHDSKLDLDKIWTNVLEGWEEELTMAVEKPDPKTSRRRAKFLASQAHDNFILSHLCSCGWQEALRDEEPLRLGW